MCFLSLGAYPVLAGRNLGYAGGAEVEQVCLARELVAHGCDVSFVTYYHGLRRTEDVNGITVEKTYQREKVDGIGILSKYRYVCSSLKKTGADIYFHEAGSYGVLPLFCLINRKKSVHRVASDAIAMTKPLSGRRGLTEKFASLLELKRANAVIAQSEFQKRILMDRLRVRSVVIKNGLLIPDVGCEKPSPPIVLWVGSISNVKNPDLFVKLAKSMPDVRFEMVGGKAGDCRLYESIKRAADLLPNVRFYGFVPYSKVNDHFSRASIFVNTSQVEGFPNTFIQAWAHYTPVVSLNVDPDNVIRRERVGFHSGTFKQLIADLTTLLEDRQLRKTMGKNARRYVEREHDIRRTVKEYVDVFERIWHDNPSFS